MGEAQTPDFYDFGIFEPVTKPQNQHCLSLDTPGHSKEIKKNPGTFWKTKYFYEMSEFGNPKMLTIFEKTGADKWWISA